MFLQLQIFLCAFLSYTIFYLTRKNFVVILPQLEQLGYSKQVLAAFLSWSSLSYGVSKYVMGKVTDRMDPRLILCGALLGVGLLSATLALCPQLFSQPLYLVLVCGALGWCQGMGWPPCGKLIVGWFGSELRGTVMALWNMAHNVGAALPAFLISVRWLDAKDWRGLFGFPAICAFVMVAVCWALVRDSDGFITVGQSQSGQETNRGEHEEGFSSDLKFSLWCLAAANACVFLGRYAITDWLICYLIQVKHCEPELATTCYWLYEVAAIPGTFLCGWLSDKLFRGNRIGVTVICLFLQLPLLFSLVWLADNQVFMLECVTAGLGCCVYGPVMTIGLQAVEWSPRTHLCRVAGFTALCGYLGGAVIANFAFACLIDFYGWFAGYLLVGCASSVAAALLVIANGYAQHDVSRVDIARA